jgi:carbon monoxide dehydrogenase subunit G
MKDRPTRPLFVVAVLSTVIALDTDGAGASAARCDLNAATPSGTGSPAEIKVEQQGDEFHVYAQSQVDADRMTIWSTLSDYDNFARFIPGMSWSRIVSRTGADAVVEQKGSAGVGPFRRSFTVLLAVREEPNQSISASGIGGDFRCFESRYEVVSLGPPRARVVYQATLLPDAALPPIVELAAMRSMIGTQFNALLAEMRRRAKT